MWGIPPDLAPWISFGGSAVGAAMIGIASNAPQKKHSIAKIVVACLLTLGLTVVALLTATTDDQTAEVAVMGLIGLAAGLIIAVVTHVVRLVRQDRRR